MRVVIQRVQKANVSVQQKIVGQIDNGLFILLGIETADTEQDIEWLCNKINTLRIFNDKEDKMNHSIHDANGHFLVVSQFTLHASTKKGTRPSYIKSAPPAISKPLYEKFCDQLGKISSRNVETGKFGAKMQINCLNDGPVTIIIDSKNKT